jgi:hypothetical protein
LVSQVVADLGQAIDITGEVFCDGNVVLRGGGNKLRQADVRQMTDDP